MKSKPTKQEITLMTLLANESTADSRKLLKKYNIPDAKDCTDLEVKLAKLYFNVPDKMQFEKELAEIHPHKTWILKRTKVEEIEKPALIETAPKTSSADGCCNNPYCPVHGKCIPVSNFDDLPTNRGMWTKEQQEQNTKQNEEFNKQHPYQMAVPIFGFVTLAAIVVYALTSINKSNF